MNTNIKDLNNLDKYITQISQGLTANTSKIKIEKLKTTLNG
jgi:hypothetical protein